MQFSFSASGTPAAVRDSINSQAKNTARGTSQTWPVAVAVRDYVNAQLVDAPADGSVSVKVDVTVSLAGLPERKVVGAVTTAEGSTEITEGAREVAGTAESTVGGVPVGEGVQLGGGVPPVARVERRVRK